MRALLLLLLFSTPAAAHGRLVDFDPHPGAVIAGDLAFREARLGKYYGGAPIVLVLGYEGCINLCGTTLDGVSYALRTASLTPERDYTALFLSIDPRDEKSPQAPRSGWHFLTGAASAASVAKAIGFNYYYDAYSGEYAHPAGFVILTPNGQVARYFEGVRYDAAEVRAALAGARRGETQSTFERVLLLCFHDPLGGRNTGTVMLALRLMIATLLVGFGVLAWRYLR
jgi:protein SCO1/2